MSCDDGTYRVMEFRVLELVLWIAVRSLFDYGINGVDLKVLVDHGLRVL